MAMRLLGHRRELLVSRMTSSSPGTTVETFNLIATERAPKPSQPSMMSSERFHADRILRQAADDRCSRR
jgi:hypothetical protein